MRTIRIPFVSRNTVQMHADTYTEFQIMQKFSDLMDKQVDKIVGMEFILSVSPLMKIHG